MLIWTEEKLDIYKKIWNNETICEEHSLNAKIQNRNKKKAIEKLLECFR